MDLSDDFYNITLNNVMQNSLYEQPGFRSVISQETLKKLNTIKFSKEKCKNDKCPILYTDFNEEDDVILLDCGHCFDPESIKKWLNEHKAECPVCRFKLDSVDVRNVDYTSLQNHHNPETFREFQDIDLSEFIAALQRSHNVLSHSSIHSSIHNHSTAALATTGAGVNQSYELPVLYIPSMHMLRTDDFYDFLFAYQQLFNL
jgi:hypothetical protein